MPKFVSKNEDAAAKKAQKDHKDQKLQGKPPDNAATYDGQKIPGGQGPVLVHAVWGDVYGQAGDWIFTGPDGSQFVVADVDVQNLWQHTGN